MSFTPWTLLIDVGIVSLLLLLGKLLRAKVAFIQRLFIPPSLIAGFCGLIASLPASAGLFLDPRSLDGCPCLPTWEPMPEYS